METVFERVMKTYGETFTIPGFSFFFNTTKGDSATKASPDGGYVIEILYLQLMSKQRVLTESRHN